MSEPEGRGMSERMAVLKAALISTEQALKIGEARLETLRTEHAELRKAMDEMTERERERAATPDQDASKTSAP
jgi:hypothetical protein